MRELVRISHLQLCNSISRGSANEHVDVGSVADEYINVFSRVGVPHEILTD